MSSFAPVPPRDSLSWAHPLVRDWFRGRFGSPTEPQEEGWPHIVAKRTVLISAPTGSGKTLAAFLAAIDRLLRKAIAGPLPNATEVLYVSPLRALSYDVEFNLQKPLAEIQALAASRGVTMEPIRTAVRTGDTLAPERRKMVERPPHILVTTPESLFILLTAERSRRTLTGVETVIIDEIHAVADDKRGAHLALSLERLDALAGRPIPRIGLSATQKPIERLGRFLAGPAQPHPVTVEIGRRREIDLAVEVPRSELGPIATNDIWDEIYDRLASLASQHRSTLIFVNTRRLSERVAYHLADRMGKGALAAHHGSLSRKIRHEAERRLKAGELRALVATASLELGIDVGTIDLVCQIGSPRSISVGLQRIGRSGHWRGAVPKGRLFATTRDDLIECAALVRAIRAGDLDAIEVPVAPLDVMGQQIVAACAAEDWNEEELFVLVRRAEPYRDLSRTEFDEILGILSEGIATRRGRHGAWLHRDRVNGRLRGRRGARLAALTNAGAIPDTALYPVVAHPDGVTVGSVDEDFAVESLQGDIFLLGNSSWKIRRVEKGRVLVEDAGSAPPNVPFWRGEAPARTPELSAHVAHLRAELSRRIGDGNASEPPKSAASAREWLETECGLDGSGAEQAITYIARGRAMLGAVPNSHTFVAERFFDEGGGMQLVIHAPLGGRINKAWGLALRKRFCRSFNFELQAAATDNGIVLSLGEQHSFPLAGVFHFLASATVRDLLEQAVLPTPLFGARWRWNAARSLAMPRFQGGRKVPPNIQRMRAEELLAAVFPEALACPENLSGPDLPIPDHPLVRETMKDALTEALDIQGLEKVLDELASGAIRTAAIDTAAPSFFAHEILNANPYAFLDDAPLEERRARAVSLRGLLPARDLGEIGRLDPEAIAEVSRQAWPGARNADELHDSLLTLIAFPESLPLSALRPVIGELWKASTAEWSVYFHDLARERRATRASDGDRSWWVPAERARTFSRLFPAARFETALPAIEAEAPAPEEAATRMLIGWLGHLGPLTSSELADLTSLPQDVVEGGLARLEGEGAVLRGDYTGWNGGQRSAIEWCERHVLARIHRQTLGRLRREIDPVTPVQFLRWLLRWQHIAPGTQLSGERGTIEALRQLQGFEAPANAWEPQILKRRIAGYDPQILDRLCLSGVAAWGRLTSPSAPVGTQDRNRRVAPSSIAPLTLFLREESGWLPIVPAREKERQSVSEAARQVLEWLRVRGASFFADILRGTGLLKAEVETALWELTSAGRVTADDFDNLRALVDPRRRAGQGRGRAHRPRQSTGRWSILDLPESADRQSALEAMCHLLLARYGVVFREMVTRESLAPAWRELLLTYRRLEDRGEVRGGRFVDGFLGEQFALPFAVESLRAIRAESDIGEAISVAASDPLNLQGILVPGERIPATSGKFVVYRDGVPVRVDDRLPVPIALAQ